MFKLTIVMALVACAVFVSCESDLESVAVSVSDSRSVEVNRPIFGAYPLAYRYLQPYPIQLSGIARVAPVLPVSPIAPVHLLPRVDLGYVTTGYKADLPYGSYSYGYKTHPVTAYHA